MAWLCVRIQVMKEAEYSYVGLDNTLKTLRLFWEWGCAQPPE